jgi:hypothetical protein
MNDNVKKKSRENRSLNDLYQQNRGFIRELNRKYKMAIFRVY